MVIGVRAEEGGGGGAEGPGGGLADVGAHLVEVRGHGGAQGYDYVGGARA